MSFLDIHAHFAEEGYEFPAEWERIKAAGVQTVVLAGDTVAHTKLHRDFCKAHAGAYFCAGVHPSMTADFSDGTVNELRALAADEKCIAIGEIGLDYHYPDDTDKAAQFRAFERQVLLADEMNLPVQIHARDCAADALSFLRDMKAYLKNGFLLHCYSFSVEMMDDFLSLGAYFSFGGVVCFKNARGAVERAAYCPVDRLLTETDSPYLSPFRGEKNSPANIPVITQKLAEIKGMELGELAVQIEKNARALFPKLK